MARIFKNKLAFTGLIVLVAVGCCIYVVYRFGRPDTIAAALADGQYRKAVQMLSNPALDGNAGAIVMLGNLHYLGLGVEQNFMQSARLYSKAAFAGSTAAQVNLGNLYSNGLGVDLDPQLAFAWFNLANNNGNNIAQVYMSEMLTEHRLNFRVVEQLQAEYATISQFRRVP